MKVALLWTAGMLQVMTMMRVVMIRMCELGLHGAVEDQTAGWKVLFFSTEA